MKIDTDLLRARLFNSARAACFGEEFQRVYYDVFEIENASDKELTVIAERMGIDVSCYEKA